MIVLVVNAQPVWTQRIKSRLEAAGAAVSVAPTWSKAADILEDLDEWPDIVIVEQRVLEKESAAVLDSLREEEWQPILVISKITRK